jgi:MoaA/NifB/PqqE/SkfB family radical SAM enzyme
MDQDFPSFVSFTVTNACNLRCQMCAQWSPDGYMHGDHRKPIMTIADWKRLVDEIADHGIKQILVRGGEPFLMPDIIALLEHIGSKGIFTAIDSNGTQLGKYAEDLVRIGQLHITVSVDGPEEIHDQVRGVKGCYRQIAEAIAAVKAAERRQERTISKSITFTISPWSYRGLGAMPDVARSLGIDSLCIVPYYYLPERLGLAYASELREAFDCAVFSWRGVHHETSGVDGDVFIEQLRRYKQRLGTIQDYPYLPLSEEEYRTWFADPVAPVFLQGCPNVERLFDVQPTGEANFCVDFPDFSYGNVRDASIAMLWNNENARRFRERRGQKPFSACHRCGAKYMAMVRD